MQEGYDYHTIYAVDAEGKKRKIGSMIAKNPPAALSQFGQDVMRWGYSTNLERDTANAVMVTAEGTNPIPKMVVIEVVERMMDRGHRHIWDDKQQKAVYTEVPKYHAQIMGGGPWGDGFSPAEAIGSLVSSHPELFNIRIDWIPGKLPR